jgi:hypothetical protein
VNEIEKQGYTPTNVLAKQGVAAVGFLAGGVLTLLMQVLGARFRIVGIVLGVLVGGAGVSGLLSKNQEDKKPGTVLALAGALELVSIFGISFTRPLAGFLLSAGALGLLAMGIIKGIKFLKGLKTRS